jgi:hypothetical protein
MAVTDFFLNGTITNSTTTTIQPASGTIYTFKRGRVGVEPGSGGTFSISSLSQSDYTWGIYQSSGVGTPSSQYAAISSFSITVYTFSETGITIVATATTIIGTNHGPSIFSAIANNMPVSIQSNAGFGLTTRYTLVGASMT